MIPFTCLKYFSLGNIFADMSSELVHIYVNRPALHSKLIIRLPKKKAGPAQWELNPTFWHHCYSFLGQGFVINTGP